ncbi:glycosyltransferase [Ruficoccus amylovorans]|uniref:Glycosyltransferase n=1 Tax=Ruficoccus amylovorans TaxID=1804625 RepID=A0A842HEU2_9BACT|nr:glycosyltransferase [Ruficoccus amylovorans]MBC2594044.1 glycosyltransferase [Ruficoccus amylovorans]
MIFLLILSCLSLLIWLVLTLGKGRFWRVRLPAKAETAPAMWPEVVAVVPARNEENGIGQCVTGLLLQDYPGGLRVVVVNDHSEDGTVAEARQAAKALKKQDRLNIINAEPLPSGWAGKVWAMHQGITRGIPAEDPAAFVWLTDADIFHGPQVLRSLVAQAQEQRLALNSRMVMLRALAAWEKFLIPAFVHFFRLLYPFARVNNPADRLAGGAGGCMLVRRESLRQAGGLEPMRGAIIDDCTLAARLKRTGPIRLELTRDSHSLRGYDGLDGILRMIRRTAYTQLNYSPAVLVGCLLGMALVFLVPVVGTFFVPGPWRVVPLAAWALMSATYVPMLRFYSGNLLTAPLLPVVALFYLKATIDSARAHHAGRGGEWKGRSGNV